MVEKMVSKYNAHCLGLPSFMKKVTVFRGAMGYEVMNPFV